MSIVGMRKRYTCAMEKIIKNAVSESSKVLETVIAELKAEMLSVRSENEILKLRCNQFEEVVKKRSVYRETGTSPEPYIIDKCDKAVQCEISSQPEDNNQKLSDNESSCGPSYENESSNDSFTFMKMDEEHDANPPREATPEKSVNPEVTINDKPEGKNVESNQHLETSASLSEKVITNTISSPDGMYEEHESCVEMEIQEACQEEADIEYANTDDSLLECQENGQMEINQRIPTFLQEEISTEEKDGVKSKPRECENVGLPVLSNENAQEQVVQETTEMDVEIDAQNKLKTGNASSAVSPVDSHAIKAQKAPPPSFKYPYFLRRQRCTSVTLEDAMLLLDAANLHEYKTSPKKYQAKHSSRHKTPETSKSINNQEVTTALIEDARNLEENASTGETIQPLAPVDVEAPRSNKKSAQSSKPSIQAAVDDSVSPAPPTLVTETDSVSKETRQTSPPATNNTTPSTSPTKQSDTKQAADKDTANMHIEGEGHDQITTAAVAKPLSVEQEQSVTPEQLIPIVTPSVQDEIGKEVGVNECTMEMEVDGQNQSKNSSSNVDAVADDQAVHSTTSTQLGETEQAAEDLKTQDNTEDLAPSTVSTLPSESEANPDATESATQISGHPALDNDSPENVSTSSPPRPSPNLVTQQTVLLKMPGEIDDESGSLFKTITSSSLSSAQLNAVVSAVRSSQNTSLTTVPSTSDSSGNKALVAVPFSLKSVMKPHHKIIVIPRQSKIPSSQTTQDQTNVLKKKLFQTEATTSVISSDVNVNPCVGDDTNELEKQTDGKMKLNSSKLEKSPCKNLVQVKLNRIPLPVLSAQTVSTSQQDVQPVENNTTAPAIDATPKLSNNRSKHSQTSPRHKIKSTRRSSDVVRLSPVVANDHSYPQHRMTKSQFLAKLEVSPVTQEVEKAESSGKDLQKTSLVERLRSHLKTHMKTNKKVQDGPDLSLETTNHISVTQETPGPNQEQSENLKPSDASPLVDEKISVNPIKTSPVTKSVSQIKQVKRKNCPTTAPMTPTKPVKKGRLKKSVSSIETLLLRGNLSPMRNKLINSNALLSCVRKGIMKKSFLCKFCRKEFVKKKDIEEHIQVHVGKKPFQCNVCHRRFSRTMELSRHLKRHNAEKKYQCTSCGKAFVEYNNLKRHTYIHTGEKPYVCPHCPRAFTQSGHMRSHIKNRHKDIKR